MALALIKLTFVNKSQCKSLSTFNYKVNLIVKQINIWLMENQMKDLIRFYLQKHVRETLIKLNLIMKNGIHIYIAFIHKRHAYLGINQD
jgi:hypothetical protein